MADAWETLRVVHKQIIEARMDLRDDPAKIRLHPWSYEGLVLDEEVTRYGQTPPYLDWRNLRLFGIPVVEDPRLPEDVIVLEGPRGRVTLLRRIETTQYRAMVRDGIRRAHPWLKLPPPVPPAEGARWVTWVFDEQPLPRPLYLHDGEGGYFAWKRPESFVTGTW